MSVYRNLCRRIGGGLLWTLSAGLLSLSLTATGATLTQRMWAAADARNLSDPAFAEAMHSADSEDRRVAALCLGRIGGEATLPLLTELLVDENKDVVHAAILGMSISGSEKADKKLRSKLTATTIEPDLLALVLVALGNVGEAETQLTYLRDIIKPMLKRRGDPTGEKLAAAAAHGLGLMWTYRRDRFESPTRDAPALLYKLSSWNGEAGIMAAFALSRVRNEKNYLKAADVLVALMKAPEPRAQFFLARTLGAQLDNKLYPEILQLALTHKDADVRSELAFALLRDKNEKRALSAWQALLKKADEHSLLAAVQAIGESEERIKTFAAQLDVIAGRSAALAYQVQRLRAVANEEESIDPVSPPVEWDALQNAIGARYKLHTNRGDIVIELNRQTPYSAYNFAKLADAKFYDGLLFPRVVPGFVAQGGDPKNDTSGGPGWKIREEISWDAHDINGVGMASSGKDTAGSQFFFNTARNPHLDFHYTVFAHVVEGQEVVAKLLPGDKLHKVVRVSE